MRARLISEAVAVFLFILVAFAVTGGLGTGM